MEKSHKKRPVRVLSLAAGGGHDLRQIRQFFPEGKVEYHHVDKDPKRAKECRVPDSGVNMVSHVSDSDSIINDSKKAPDAFFDQVHLNMQTGGQRLLASRQRLRSLGRIIRPGGRLLVTEQGLGVRSRPSYSSRKRLDNGLFLTRETKKGGRFKERHPRELKRIEKLNRALVQRILDAGFGIERIQLLPEDMRSPERPSEKYETPVGVESLAEKKLADDNPEKILSALTAYPNFTNQILVLKRQKN